MKRKKPKIRAKAKITIPDGSSFVSLFAKESKITAGKIGITIAEEIAAEAKEIIKSQRYIWVPLSPDYLEAKREAGLDTRILIATGFYIEHIESWVDLDGNAHVGVKPGVIHEPSGLPLTMLARIHEFGTATVPPRQLWRPLLAKYVKAKPRFAGMYRRAVAKAIKEAKIKTKTHTTKD